MTMIKRLAISTMGKLGYTVFKHHALTMAEYRKQFRDMDDDFFPIFERCKDYSMTDIEKLFAIYKAVEYVTANGTPGAIVECGVWRGGSMMCAALSLLHFKDSDRPLYLYDTFEGMTAPMAIDVDIDGASARDLMPGYDFVAVGREEVESNIYSTGYPRAQIHFVKGKVEDTLPGRAPTSISLLRLDTDWYESTYHEMRCLFPLLSKGGILIQDDYGHWQGAREATDKYLSENKIPLLLHRVDYSCRVGVK
jgi:O-methyltransferase